MFTIICLCIFSYLIGSIPFALIVGKKLYNVDIRTLGSGNLGTTNTIRNLGKKAGFLVFILDFLKGIVSLILARIVIGENDYLAVFGAFTMIGHIFPIFANFKGGKAVATGTGVFMFLYPILCVVLMLIFFSTIFLTGYVSLGSVIISFLGGIYILINGTGVNRYVMAVMCILVIYMHKKNMIRIKNGVEYRSKLKIKFGGENDKNN